MTERNIACEVSMETVLNHLIGTGCFMRSQDLRSHETSGNMDVFLAMQTDHDFVGVQGLTAQMVSLSSAWKFLAQHGRIPGIS